MDKKTDNKESIFIKADSLKEKTYNTKQVVTSVAILESPENDVVLDALLFLSKYADLKQENCMHLYKNGIIPKLFTIMNRNLCILRLTLRLLSTLLSLGDVIYELDQEKYEKSLKFIIDMFVQSEDQFIKEICLEIIDKMTNSCRMMLLIYKTDIFDAVLSIILETDSFDLLIKALNLFCNLLEAPSIMAYLTLSTKFKLDLFQNLLDLAHYKVKYLVLDIFTRLCSYGIDEIMMQLRDIRFVEKMLSMLMNSSNKIYHDKIMNILNYCMSSDETNTYFVKSVEFLDFCLWCKTCDPEYMLPSVMIFEKLSSVPALRQTLFDLSAEETILYFLRSTDKYILNTTCKAISNMSAHQYCCEAMLTPVVARELIEMLKRNDEEVDRLNEVALKTILMFSRRKLTVLELLYKNQGFSVLIDYLQKNMQQLCEESILNVLEILNKGLNSFCSEAITCPKFYHEIMRLFSTSSEKICSSCLEIMNSCAAFESFRLYFQQINGPKIIIDYLKKTSNFYIFRDILILIYSLVSDKIMCQLFLKEKLLQVFKLLPESIVEKSPLVQRVSNVLYDCYLPAKFFESKRLDFTDHISEKFYIIDGKGTEPFPFLEVLEALKISTNFTIYVVDVSFYSSLLNTTTLIRKSVSCYTKLIKNDELNNSMESINFGALSPDPYLPVYIHHIKNYFGSSCIEHRCKILAHYVNDLLCGPKENLNNFQKLHTFKLHLQHLKHKLGTNMIPVGFLRLGFHLQKSLLFKAIADCTEIPCSLVKNNNIYWNEVAFIQTENDQQEKMKCFVVDLMGCVGEMYEVGSKEAAKYCSIT